MVCGARVITDAMPGDRRQHAAGQHVRGDQRADRNLSVHDEKDADDDHQQIVKLLRGVGAGQRERRPEVNVFAGARGRRDRALPGRSASAPRRRWRARSRCPEAIRPERHAARPIPPATAAWRDRADAGCRSRPTIMIGNMISGNPRQRAGDDEQHDDEQDREQQIGCRHDAARREELAHRIEIAHLIGEDADRWRALRHLHRQHVLEDVGGQHYVDLLAGHVDDAAADRAQHEIEDDGDAPCRWTAR